MITYSLDGLTYYPKVWEFPCGEIGVKLLDGPTECQTLQVNAALQSSKDIMTLILLTDALKRHILHESLELVVGYLPYARQDRVCSSGESLSLVPMMNIINSLGYQHITLLDPHSSVTDSLRDTFTTWIVSGERVLMPLIAESPISFCYGEPVLVLPDAGAKKKWSGDLNYAFHSVVTGDKVREMSTGNITSYSFDGNVRDKPCIVVDDICDGGATFLLLGNALKEAGAKDLTLIVTHGIFTKGTEELLKVYDNIITTNSYHMEREGLWEDGVYYQQIYKGEI